MDNFSQWRQFKYQDALVHLWVFEASATPAKFRAWHVRTDEALEQFFRRVITAEVERVTETLPYTPLTQNNDNSCLLHDLHQSEGLAALLAVVNVPESEQVRAVLKQLEGAMGYLVKFQTHEQTVFAVKKTSQTWKPRRRWSFTNAVFVDGELSLAPSDMFAFEEFFDFYCLDHAIFVVSKRAYESAASDKSVYIKNFESLIDEPQFLKVLSDVAPLKDYVGNNAMQLKRMTVVKRKALYLQLDFIQRVSWVSQKRGWGLEFDSNGRIVFSESKARDIIQILLDHRLLSEISETIYDVPDAHIV